MDKALDAGARALCKASGDDWLREGPGGLMDAYGPLAQAVVTAYLAALPATDTSGLRRNLLGVSSPVMRGDNLAIMLASFFEPGIEDEELDDSGTWKQGAIDAADEVLSAIHAHYADRIEALRNAHLPEGTVSALLGAKNAGEAADAYRTRAEKAEAQLAEAEAVIRPLMEQAEHVALGIACRKPDLSNASTALVYAAAAARSYLEGRK